MTTITPRHNFAKLFGLMWLAPLFPFIMVLINDPNNLLIWGLAMVSLILAYGLIKGQNWVRYLIVLGIIGFSSLGLWMLYQEVQAFEENLIEFYIIAVIALSCFSFGMITFLFNAGMIIELNRSAQQSINYAQAFSKHQADKWYLLKHQMNLSFSLGLIFIASSIIYWLIFYAAILDYSASFALMESLQFITFLFPLVTGIGLFFKSKIFRDFIPILMITIILMSFADVLSYNLNTEETILMIGNHLMVIWILTLLTLMLFHPLMTFSFEQTIHRADDDEDILDVE